MSTQKIQKIERASVIYYAVPLLITVAAVIFSYLFYTSKHQLRTAEEERYQALLLTEQLRQSSDQLSTLARSYVATGEERYRDYFETVLQIRDGRHPRPTHYNRAYWDLLMPEGSQPPFPDGEAKPFQHLLRESGFTDEELELLIKAQKASDNLALIETEAFFAMEGIFKDEQGHYNLHRPPSPSHALKLLFGQPYMVEKAKIMGFINHFYDLQAARTGTAVAQLSSQTLFYSRAALVSFILLIVTILLVNISRIREHGVLMGYLEEEIKERTEQLQDQNRELVELIDHLNNAREQLVDAEKMSAIGKMVAGFAHEINTPIGIGVTAASSIDEQSKKLQRQQAEGTLSLELFEKGLARMDEGAELILKNMQRASELITSFKEVTVDQSVENRRTINLNHYLDEVIMSVKPRFKHQGVNINNRVDAQLLVKLNPGVIAQVFTNLIINACIHAFDGKEGEIEISSQQDSEWLTLTFQDNGCGMSAEVLESIYTPFYTTRRNSGGTGLGMHIVHNLITEQLGGQVRCESTPGEGTRFYIQLPVSSIDAETIPE